MPRRPSTPQQQPFRDRIRELRRVPASSLIANPLNWRIHGEQQKGAVTSLMHQFGIVDAIIARENEQGQLEIIDGHLRTDVVGDQQVPVLVLDVTAEEAAGILATFDGVGGLAETDVEKLRALTEGMLFAPEVDQMLNDLMEQSAAEATDNSVTPEESPDETTDVNSSFTVVVKCASEQDQLQLINQMSTAGRDVRALTAAFPSEAAEPLEPPPEIAAAGRLIRRTTDIRRSPRVLQMEGLFDVPPARKNRRQWRLDFSLPEAWSIGLIVGPSGSGKSTIAKELFGERLIDGWPWPEQDAILDGFPEAMGISEITGLLSSVGFSSQPSWLKPFGVLSNGEKFRVNLARTMAEAGALSVVDEFTSVVDRRVAQIGSCALAATVRRTNRRFVAVACHYDIIDWLNPDWVVDLGQVDEHDRVTLERRSLRRRPDVTLNIRRGDYTDWPLFRQHHYLSGSLSRSAKCFVAEVDGRPAAFTGVMHFPHPAGSWWREHRTVCLPDYQGVGIGNRLSEFVASLFQGCGKPYRSTTSHPGMIRHRLRSPLWRCLRAPSMVSQQGASDVVLSHSSARLTAGFEYTGPGRPDDARTLAVFN
jgi:energy-coupling factor transporter ATP-binding protein EcfA2